MTDEGLGNTLYKWGRPGEAGFTEIDVLILCAKPPVIGEHVLHAAADKPAGPGVVPAALEKVFRARYYEPPMKVDVSPCTTTGEVRQPVAESIADLAPKG